ncbi:twin-arginine translocation signal domain-containing protein [Haladaptatus sp. NG-SE-30]
MFESHDSHETEPIFENSPVSRRQFLRLSAATAGVLSLSQAPLLQSVLRRSSLIYTSSSSVTSRRSTRYRRSSN